MEFDLSIDAKEVSIIIKDFIKTYVKNSGCKNVVIGLSGGLDSSTVSLLCKDVFGKENTKCVFLPDKSTPEKDFKHMKLLVEKFNLSCRTKDITKLVQQISGNCFVKPDKFALANVKARTRMLLLFEYANMIDGLVCGTSNKSEMLIGYFTKYGDGGVDIQPLGDLYKSQVYQLAKHLKIPKEIIRKPPTAGLWKGQTDEQELQLDYKNLDQVLAGLEQKIGVKKIARSAGVKLSDVKRIRDMRIKSQHKRRLALIPKIGLRTPGLDWRTPIQKG